MAELILIPLVSAGVAALAPAGAAAATVAAFGAVGTAIGGALGSYITQTLIYPALFKQKTVDGPKLDDLRVQTATEGSPMNFTLGTMRVGGTLIWSSDLIETTKKKGSKKSGKTRTTTYTVDVAISFGEGVRNVAKIFANGKEIYDLDHNTDVVTHDARYEEIEVYPGTLSQGPSPIIESYEGAGNVPPFRGTCYVVIKGLQVADFGNGIPQFTAVIEQEGDAGVSLQDAIDTIFKHAGWNEDFYDLSDLPDVITDDDLLEFTVRGMSSGGPTDIAKLLEPLITVYRLILREQEGVIKIMGRDSTDVIAVDEKYFGTSESPTYPYSVSDQPNRDLPSEVSVRFIDAENNFDQGQKSERYYGARTNNSVTIDVPLAMRQDQARKLAIRLLWSSYAEAQTFKSALPPAFMAIQEGDVLQRNLGGRTRSVRMTELNRGWNSGVEISGSFENNQTLTEIKPPTYTPGPNPNGPKQIYQPYVYVLDIPPVRTEDVGVSGVYVAACRSLTTNPWQASQVYYNFDGTTDFIDSVDLPDESTIGICNSTLGEPPSYPDNPDPAKVPVRDDTNVLTVTLKSGTTLESVTDLQCRQGNNLALVGNELVGFMTVTKIGDYTYELSGLYRGARDTMHAIRTHAANEVFALVDETLRFINIPIENLGENIYYRGVPVYGNVANYTTVIVPWHAENMIPFRVHGIESIHYPNNDIEIGWNRQSRYPRTLVDYRTGTLDEPFERYELLIYDAGSFVPLHTADVNDAQNFVYTADQQTADGRTPGDPVRVRIRQRGAFIDFGRVIFQDDL